MAAKANEEEEDKPISEDEILESLGLKDVARTASGKIDHAKLSMKDRMAIVRGMRKRRRKYGVMPVNAGGAPKSPSPKEESIADEDLEDEFVVPEGQYKGHVTEIVKFQAKLEDFVDDTCSFDEIQHTKPDVVLQDCDQPRFLVNLNLFSREDVDSILSVLKEDRRKKIEFRNQTYIPEMTDKKLKVSYNYLAPDISSPPLLRTRQRRPQVTTTATSSRFNSRSNSRATTPERSITRQISSESSINATAEVANVAKSAERTALEIELSGLQKRSEELQCILAANKRTVSTRVSWITLVTQGLSTKLLLIFQKERSRLSEVSDEAVQLEARIEQIKSMIAAA